VNILNLFFLFPTNNFCHKFVERIFGATITYLENRQKLIPFLEETKLIGVLIQKEKENKEQKERSHFMPFLHSLGTLLLEKAYSNEELHKFLESSNGWEGYVSMIREERQKLERSPLDIDSDSEGPYGNASISMSNDQSDDMDSDEPNDADDYDTEQAEILLTKAEIESVC